MEKSTILVVDDANENLHIVKQLLIEEYTVKLAKSGEIALKIISRSPPDLILLDIMMPGIDGYEVCQQLKNSEQYHEIPIIFLSACSESKDEAYGLNLGAVDYITKPINPDILKVRVKTHLALGEARRHLKNQNHLLEEKVKLRTRQIDQLQDATMIAMGAIAECRDKETGNHIRRTQYYIKTLAIEMAKSPKCKQKITEEIIELLYKSAPLHDIGKVGVPDHILLKAGKLSKDEFEEMKHHSQYGHKAIAVAEDILSEPESFLAYAKDIALYHHEKWDGSGYPLGLTGEEIPFSARLMAIADVYDALISKRCYKEAFSHETAITIIREGKNKHFDPNMVDIFLSIHEKFQAIAKKYSE